MRFEEMPPEEQAKIRERTRLEQEKINKELEPFLKSLRDKKEAREKWRRENPEEAERQDREAHWAKIRRKTRAKMNPVERLNDESWEDKFGDYYDKNPHEPWIR